MNAADAGLSDSSVIPEFDGGRDSVEPVLANQRVTGQRALRRYGRYRLSRLDGVSPSS